MFFILSKILSFFIHPFSWILILVFWAWRTKHVKRRKRLVISSVVATFFFTNTVIFCEFTRLWEVEGQRIEEVGEYDVGIVLGGMAQYDNSHERLSLRRGGDRIWQALHLYHLGKVKKIMIVGANGDIQERGLREADQFRDVLLDFGIPAEDILVESNSKNTYQNAVETKAILDTHPELQDYLLITSSLHMRRSRACFTKAGFSELSVFTTDHFTGETRGYTFGQFLVPNFSNMTDWSRLIHEWVGYVTYAMMGYL